MLSYSPSLKIRAQAELELRRRRATWQSDMRRSSVADFASRTQIEVPNGSEVAHVRFDVWDQQDVLLRTMIDAQLLVVLKARQLGISWLACLYALRLCTLYPGQPVLCLSRGQLEADELVHRISFMHHQHADKALLPKLIKDNTADLEWANASSVISLAATKNAGRSLTASLAILDEWAFMAWPRQTLAAVKPTIDAGGKLFIISSADGMGSAYHQFWQQATEGSNGYTAVFLPWFAHPDRDAAWREQKIIEASGDTASVLREYPANEHEAFTAATDTIFGVWSDGPLDGNVTEDAEYIPDGGEIAWGVDDGYVGKLDPTTGTYTADSHPRVFGLYQLRNDGRICRFYEDYAVGMLSEDQIERVMALPYPFPSFAVVDKSAAELKGRLHAQSVYTRNSPSDVEESIKEMRRAIAPDKNKYRRFLVHPRCKHFRSEMVSYRRDANGKIVKAYDHGIDEARYLCWTQRFEV